MQQMYQDASLVNIFMKSSMMYFVISVLGVLIFVGLTAYDTQKIKNMYAASDTGELMGKKAVGAIKAVVKEAITGALLGILMMLVVFPFAWWQGEGPLIASAVGISLISITTLAATTGAILPLLFDRMRLDPALMSSPFITTVTDIAGVFIYLSTAKWLLTSTFL